MPNEIERPAASAAASTPAAAVLSRREAIQRVGAMLGGVALIGGSSLLAACERGERPAAVADGNYQPVGAFSAADVAMLDEVADTILPTTAKSPGAKAAATGPFMALMVTDTYHAPKQQVFRDGLRKIDDATRKAANVSFMEATPAQRLAVLTAIDREQKDYMDALGKAQLAAAKRSGQTETGPGAPPEGTSQTQGPAAAAAGKKAQGDSADQHLADQRQENAGTGDVASGAMASDAPPHYFRMMKELALLGYFTSEVVGKLPTTISGHQTQRYVDTPGRFDPCLPYVKGTPALLPHA
ncbi:MAG TPA: gluconate 2-dehydrogenase subunit 3 family protein [Gemmatirosa sp.]